MKTKELDGDGIKRMACWMRISAIVLSVMCPSRECYSWPRPPLLSHLSAPHHVQLITARLMDEFVLPSSSNLTFSTAKCYAAPLSQCPAGKHPSYCSSNHRNDASLLSTSSTDVLSKKSLASWTSSD